jgi:uncharacterized protein YkwD
MDRSLRASWFAFAPALVVLLGCSSAPRVPGADRAFGTTGASTPAPAPDPNAERYAWEASTRSPQPLDASLVDAACGPSDRALLRVAERILGREAKGLPLLDTSEISFALRSGGAPYVWPRAWTARGTDDEGTRRAKVAEWLASLSDEGDKRCAVASSLHDGQAAFAAVAVTVRADLEPLPTRVPVGTWLDLRGVLLVPTSRVEVVVLGPRGRPHAVLASHSANNVRARFRADRAGTWLVQLIVTTEGGPQLAAEAIVAAGVPPPETFDTARAPGETSVPRGATPRDALLAMVNGARASEGLPGVRRDERLDHVALGQAEIMRERRTLSHDAGGAGMSERLSSIALRSAGENGAHATDLSRAHRALWRSPSHRENLLHPAFELVGIGIAPDDDGSVWVCEIFADPN